MKLAWYWNPRVWGFGRSCLNPYCCRWCYVFGPLEIKQKAAE